MVAFLGILCMLLHAVAVNSNFISASVLPDALWVSNGGTHNVVEGHVIQVYCYADDITAPTIRWEKGGTEIFQDPPHIFIRTSVSGVATSSVLTIDQFNFTDDGVYSCISTVDSTSISSSLLTLTTVSSSDSTSLTISRQPADNEQNFVNTLTSEDVIANSRTGVRVTDVDPAGTSDANKLMTCIAGHVGGASAVPTPPTLVWTRNGEAVVADGTHIITDTPQDDQLQSNLQINSFTDSDAGIYQCMYTDSDSDAEVATSLPHRLDYGDVLRLSSITPQLIIIEPPERLVIEVQSSGAYDAIIWRRNGVAYTFNDPVFPIRSDRFFYFYEAYVREPTSMDDLGLYEVQVLNAVDQSTTLAPDLFFTVVRYVAPITTTTQSLTKTVMEGGSLTLACTSQGTPTPTFTWRLNGEDIPTNRHTNTPTAPDVEFNRVTGTVTSVTNGMTTSVLTISGAVFPDDDGVYECIGTNSHAGMDNSSSAFIQLSVQVEPEVEVSATPQARIALRQSVSLFCNVTRANPNVNFTYVWRRVLVSTLSEETNTLVLSNITADQFGTYQCEVTNDAGSGSATIPIEQGFLPSVSVDQPAPVIIGTSIIIECSASGDTPINYMWEQVGQGGVVLSTEESFTLMVTDVSQYGMYRCTATNILGSDSGTVDVVQAYPGVPVDFMVSVTASTVIFALWRAPDAPNGVITSYNLYYSQEVNTVFPEELFVSVDSVDGRLEYNRTLTNLSANTQYRLEVSAFTRVGESERSQPIFVTTDPDSASPPSFVSALTVNSTAIQLTWGYPEVPRSTILGYTILYEVLGECDGPSQEVNYTLQVVDDMTNQTLVLGSLEEYTQYSFVVAAYSSTHSGVYSAEVTQRTDEDAPSAPPRNVSATPQSSTSVLVSWEPPLCMDQNGVITSYRLNFTSDEEFASGGSRDVNAPDTMMVVEGLEEFVKYDFVVAAVTSEGIGPYSDNVTATTLQGIPASAPLHISGEFINSTGLSVSWELPPVEHRNGIIRGFNVTYNSSQGDIQETSVEGTSVDLFGLEEFTNYTISVAAFTDVGTGPTAVIVVQTDSDAPSASPVNIVVDDMQSTSISLSWFAPPERDQNGIISVYYVRYRSVFYSTEEVVNTTNTSITLLDLEEFEEYSIAIAAATDAGIGPYSVDMVVTTAEAAPSAPPQNVSATPQSSTSVLVSWEPPPRRDRNGVSTSYHLNFTSDEEFANGGSRDVNSSDTMMVVDGLEEFVKYNFVVAALTSEGIGPYSDTTSATTFQDVPSSAPLNISGEFINSTGLSVSWELPPVEHRNGIIRGFNVTYNSSQDDLQETSVERTSVDLFGLEEFTNYTISVAAFTDVGTSLTAVIVVQTDSDAPSTSPVDITVGDMQSTSISLSWFAPPERDQNGIISVYYVRYRSVSYSTEEVMNTTNTSITLLDLEEFEEYSIAIAAATDAGIGPYSVDMVVTTSEAAPSAPPQNVSATPQSSTAVLVSWEPPPRRNQNGNITSYRLNFTSDEEFANGGSLDVNTLDTMIVIDGLEAFVEYDFVVAAVTSEGIGPFSGATTATTLQAAPSAPPQNVSATPQSSTSVLVSWEPPPRRDRNGVITSYRLNFTSDEEFANGGSRDVNTPDTMMVVQGLEEFVKYDFVVAALTSVGIGPYSDITNATTFQDEVPDPPVNVTVVVFGSRWVVISWEAAFDGNRPITQYIIYQSTESGNFTEVNRTTVIESSGMTINISTGIFPYTNYSFTVQACNVMGCGDLGEPSPEIRTEQDTPEAAPEDLTAVPLSFMSVFLSWSPPPEEFHNGIIMEYRIQYTPSGSSLPVRTALSTDTMETLTDLVCFTEYNIEVSARTAAPDFGPSAPATIRTLNFSSSPPTNLVATNVQTTDVYLNWTEPGMPCGIISHYTVYYTGTKTTVVEGFDPVSGNLETSGPETEIVVTDLIPDTVYIFSIAAMNRAGEGARSAQLETTTLVGPPPVILEPDPGVPPIGGPRTYTLGITRPSNINGPISHYHVVVVLLRTGTTPQDNGLSNPDTDYPTLNSLTQFSYSDNADCVVPLLTEQEAYIAAEFGDNDFPDNDVYIVGDPTQPNDDDYENGPLCFGATYTFFLRAYVQGSVSRKRQTNVQDREYTAFSSSAYSAAVTTASLVPVNFEIRVDGPRTLTFSWDHPQGFETSGFITNYQLTCFPRLLGFPKVYVSHEFTEHGVVATESGFSPSTIYNCSVLAANRLGEGPSTSVVATTLEDTMLFQLQITGVPDCSLWATTGAEEKLEDIHDELQNQISSLCSCEFTPQHITTGELQCFTSSVEVTYRTRLSGTTFVTSSEILGYLEEWVTSGTASILVQGFRLNLDSSCLPVALDSLADSECETEGPQSDASGSDNTLAIVGGVIAGVVIIAVALIIVTVYLLVRRKRRAKFSIHKNERGGPITVTESAAYMAKPRLPPPRSTATSDDEAHEYEMVAMKNPAYGPVKRSTHRQQPVQTGSAENEESSSYENVGQLDEDAYEIIPADFQ